MIILATKGVPVFSLLRCMDGRVKPGHDEKPKGATRTLLEQAACLTLKPGRRGPWPQAWLGVSTTFMHVSMSKAWAMGLST